jgi:DNA transformation protein
MPVSDGYLAFVLDQLRPTLPGVRARRMFGGVGLYADELFFALIDDDTLYFKVDDVTREEFTARGMPQFHPMPDMASMNYYQLPEEVLEEPEPLRAWTERAVDVARRARSRKGKGTGKGKGGAAAPRKRSR